MRTTLALVLAVGLASVPVLAQESPLRDPKAVALLSGAMAALGGPGIAAVADTRAEITVRSFGSDTVAEVPVVLKTLGRKAWRIEGGNAGNGPATVVNGDWGVSQSDGEVRRFPTVAVAEAGNWRIPWLTIIADVNDPEVEVTYVEVEQGGGVHHVRLHRKTRDAGLAEVLQPCDVLLDAQTGLPLKLTFSAHPPENLLVSIPIEIEYSDYRAFSGLLIPTRIRHSILGQLMSEILVTQFSINTGLSPADFQVR